jgi:pimeloyl-ACP methyl ester carboxylesterase
VYEYAKTEFETISLFGCSIGAYFAMLAFGVLPIKQAVFLSPVVDMARIIENIMAAFNITPEDLKQAGIIETPVKKLYFDYYDYVKNTPVKWGVPTEILYGENDDICEQNIIRSFAENSGAKLTVAKNCEHWFHTNYQLDVLRKWLTELLVSV